MRVKLEKGDQVKIVKDGTGEYLNMFGLVKEVDELCGAPNEKPDTQYLVNFGEAWFSRDELRKMRDY